MITETKNAAVVAKLNRFVHDLHVEWYPDIFKPYNYELIHEMMQEKMKQPEHIFFLIEDEDEPVGFVWVEERHQEENDFKMAHSSMYVHQISVDTTKQQKGYGRQLLNKVEELALEKGIHEVELDYWLENEGAQTFYEKQGFTKQREFVRKRLK
ncbi:GNAT family N-acetyltransferase [Halobacillus salinus]|uniref:GNAT family N-acetyltransferase n=1 Tax=Halobacillus salinus TaxID=192814 RepID=UPI0009A599F6|nr:GNAT family N-acetyltransferase [Halobacillus salinus]